MGHSFSTFRNHHVHAKDYKVEAWLLLMIRRFDAVPVESQLKHRAMTDYWRSHVATYGNGCLDPMFDEFLTSDDVVADVLEAAQAVTDHLAAFGPLIPKEYLNDLIGLRPPFDLQSDNETRHYLQYAEAIVLLLSGDQTEELVNA